MKKATLMALGAMLLASPAVFAAERYIAVNGQASAAVTPDEVVLTVAFSDNGQEADQLLANIRQQALPFLDAIQKLGIAKADIQGSRFEVYPRYEDSKNVGLTAKQSYRITMHEFALYPKVLTAAVTAKADNIGQAQLAYSKQPELYKKLLAKAVKDAKEKATILAHAGGSQLGKVINIEEQGSNRSPVIAMKVMAARAPIQTPGQIEVDAAVQARFSIKD
ncbi:SIMPL domain-containing protein [Gallaecimonas mangrovi]|uniref:SIMPL domain-containing protein n=1 Tax=Gallaecimonas mangrovi TaxID=2291597 RepID=UPI000E1FC1F1|nr:SIMPL domain-containing protein [Gallaecimonas mangrovi]